jgi:DNA-binding response OmpR family regulator
MLKREAGRMPKILIVEDDDSICFIMKEVLQSTVSDSTVTTASSGRQFLQLLDATRPDLILLDVRLPDIDGLTLYREVRKNEGAASVPVLFVTANPDLVASASLTGPHETLRKPFDLDVLTHVVGNLLRQKTAFGC